MVEHGVIDSWVGVRTVNDLENPKRQDSQGRIPFLESSGSISGTCIRCMISLPNFYLLYKCGLLSSKYKPSWFILAPIHALSPRFDWCSSYQEVNFLWSISTVIGHIAKYFFQMWSLIQIIILGQQEVPQYWRFWIRLNDFASLFTTSLVACWCCLLWVYVG